MTPSSEDSARGFDATSSAQKKIRSEKGGKVPKADVLGVGTQSDQQRGGGGDRTPLLPTSS